MNKNEMILEIIGKLGFDVGGCLPPLMFDLSYLWCDERVVLAIYDKFKEKDEKT